MKSLTKETIQTFREKIYTYYTDNKRDFPWRKSISPYKVVVSEIMLQQTQALRVVEKFKSFIKKFPNFKILSQATLREVLTEWQGLGYNRRAKFLHELVKQITKKYNGKLPPDPKVLTTLPGIGPNTAGSICAFAFDKPVIFIETNIRSVFIHEFFGDKNKVDDKEILILVEQTLDTNNPREWYSALMDYGAWLKSQEKNPSRKSKHYTKQSKFHGSDRELRGRILKLLTRIEKLTQTQRIKKLGEDPTRIKIILESLEKEQMVQRKKTTYFI